jgi:hypothetical protein
LDEVDFLTGSRDEEPENTDKPPKSRLMKIWAL